MNVVSGKVPFACGVGLNNPMSFCRRNGRWGIVWQPEHARLCQHHLDSHWPRTDPHQPWVHEAWHPEEGALLRPHGKAPSHSATYLTPAYEITIGWNEQMRGNHDDPLTVSIASYPQNAQKALGDERTRCSCCSSPESLSSPYGTRQLGPTAGCLKVVFAWKTSWRTPMGWVSLLSDADLRIKSKHSRFPLIRETGENAENLLSRENPVGFSHNHTTRRQHIYLLFSDLRGNRKVGCKARRGVVDGILATVLFLWQ